jgi:acyl-CoA reductase-like NAD-dependent aldehyde dehydrogenase
MLEASDTTPASTVAIAELMSGFLPPGVFNVVCGDRGTGRAVVTHPAPAMVSITGGVRAGKQAAFSRRARFAGCRDVSRPRTGLRSLISVNVRSNSRITEN